MASGPLPRPSSDIVRNCQILGDDATVFLTDYDTKDEFLMKDLGGVI
jgi:hypothetical protein